MQTYTPTIDDFERNGRLRLGFQLGLALAVCLFGFLLLSITTSSPELWGFTFILMILLVPVLAVTSAERLLRGLGEWHLEISPWNSTPVGKSAAQVLRDHWTRRMAVFAGVTGLLTVPISLSEGEFAAAMSLGMISATSFFFAFAFRLAIPDGNKSRKQQYESAARKAASPAAKRLRTKEYWSEGCIFAAVITLVLARLAKMAFGAHFPTQHPWPSLMAALLIGVAALIAYLYTSWRTARVEKTRAEKA